MPRNYYHDDDSFDDDEDYGEEFDGSEEEPTQECPYCRCEVLEVLVQCPKCGNYFSKEDVAHRGPGIWIRIIILLCLAGFLIGLLF